MTTHPSGETRNYISVQKERSRLWDRSLCVYGPVAGDELTLSVLHDLTLQVNLFSRNVVYWLHGSTMECLLAFSVAGVAGVSVNAS